MLKQLYTLFRGSDSMQGTRETFVQMLDAVRAMADKAEPAALGGPLSPETQREMMKLDVQVNRFENEIRRRVVAHMALERGHVTTCLLFVTLVSDIERIGDYLKNAATIPGLCNRKLPVPEDGLMRELSSLIGTTTRCITGAVPILESQDPDAAEGLVADLRALSPRYDTLVHRVAAAGHASDVTTALVLLTRAYKRITSHLRKVVSSVTHPVQEIDAGGDPESSLDGTDDSVGVE